jgi:hypothetical protein
VQKDQGQDSLLRELGLTRLVDDLAADDFETLRAKLAKRLAPVALGNRIQRIRTVFKCDYDAGLIEMAGRCPNRRWT